MKIKLFHGQRTNKSTGEQFISYSTKGKDGKWYNVRFGDELKDCIADLPEGKVLDTVTTDNDSIYIPNSNAQYPILIIMSCDKYTTRKLITSSDKKNKNTEEDDTLPF